MRFIDVNSLIALNVCLIHGKFNLLNFGMKETDKQNMTEYAL